MKKCPRCKIEKDESMFNKQASKKDGLQCHCKECNKAHLKRHYNANRYYYINKNNVTRDANKLFFNAYKEEKGCLICGNKIAVCLDFHHIDSETKDDSVADLVNQAYSKKRIMSEIDKCVILCSNCHRMFHAGLISI